MNLQYTFLSISISLHKKSPTSLSGPMECITIASSVTSVGSSIFSKVCMLSCTWWNSAFASSHCFNLEELIERDNLLKGIHSTFPAMVPIALQVLLVFILLSK